MYVTSITALLVGTDGSSIGESTCTFLNAVLPMRKRGEKHLRPVLGGGATRETACSYAYSGTSTVRDWQ